MAVRQYIGARYVPKFFENSATGDTTWAANTAYEPLTIVTYNGNSYTSKKTVPAGIGNPSANPEYWASTGMFNAQVETIREAVEENAADIADLQTLREKRYIFIGDSYSQAESGYIPNNLPLYIPHKTFNSFVMGGAGFVGAAQGKTFITLLNEAIEAIEDPETITDIIVAGGCNDANTTTAALNSAINSFLSLRDQYFPNAFVHLFCIGGFADPTERQKLYSIALNNYSFPMKNKAVGYRDAIIPMMRVDYLQTDGVHPTSEGVRAIAGYLAGKLSGENAYIRTLTYDITAGGATFSAITSENGIEISALMNYIPNGQTYTVSSSAGITIDFGVVTGACIAPDRQLASPNTKTVTMRKVIPAILAITTTGSSFTIVPGEIAFAASSDGTHLIFTGRTATNSGDFTSGRIMPLSATLVG